MSVIYDDQYILWIVEDLYNIENLNYQNQLKSEFPGFKFYCYNLVENIIKNIKQIEFENTYVIINGRIYKNFMLDFYTNMKDIYTIPKFVIFSPNTSLIIKDNSINYFKNSDYFYYSKIQILFDDVIKFIKNDNILYEREISNYSNSLEILKQVDEINQKNNNQTENKNLIFEYIDCKEKLYLPVYFRTMIKINPDDKFDKLTYDLYEEYKNDQEIGRLLSQIANLKNIPIELLCKYWAKLYTCKGLHHKINQLLETGKTGKYSLFIKMLYEGVRLKILKSPIINYLYRGDKIKKDEIEKIKKYLAMKNVDFPSSILFTKTFMSFSKELSVAKDFAIDDKYLDENIKKRVLFVLKNNNLILDEIFNTHADLEKISSYDEKEILFFPFSCFEVVQISEIIIDNKEVLKIDLNYISHYDSKLKNENTINEINIHNIPIDSKFKNEIMKTDIINQEELSQMTVLDIINNANSFLNETKSLIESKESNFSSISFDKNNNSNSNKLSISDLNILNSNNSKENIILEQIPEKNDNNNNDDNNINKICLSKKKLILLISFIIISLMIIIIVVLTIIYNKNKKKNNLNKNKVNYNNITSNSDINYLSDMINNSDINDSSKINDNNSDINNFSDKNENSEINDISDINTNSGNYNFDYCGEDSEIYHEALFELERNNNYRKKYGLNNLTIECELIELAIDKIIDFLLSGDLNVGGNKKNSNGESIGEYMLLQTQNNTYIPGYATEVWYNSIFNSTSKDEHDEMLSSLSKEFGFGVVCVSDGCMAIAFYYPSNKNSSYALFI